MRYGDCDEFVEIDMGGRRLTHHPSGDTALRHEWMLDGGRGFDAWRDRLVEFAAVHPGCHVMKNSRNDVVDDFRTWPPNGGDHMVGDVVVSLSRFGRPEVAREIVSRVPLLPEGVLTSRHDLGHQFVLDDGTPLYWSSDNGCWSAAGLMGEWIGRTRPPVTTDRLEDLTPSSERLASIVCAKLAAALSETVGTPDSVARERTDPKILSEAQDHVRILGSFVAGITDGGSVPSDAVLSLREASAWLLARRAADDLHVPQSFAEAGAVKRATAVADTIERRSLVDAAPHP